MSSKNSRKPDLTWNNILTKDQKRRLTEDVFEALRKLASSQKAKDLLGHVQIGFHSTCPPGGGGIGHNTLVYLTSEGIKFEESWMEYEEREYSGLKVADGTKIRELIELCKISPKGVVALKSRIEM